MNVQSPQKRGHDNSFEYEGPPFGLPRKKFISEESFTKDMAAMTLDPTPPPPQTSEYNDESDEPDLMAFDGNRRVTINVDQNGLPIEIRPGENKPRIPSFVLGNPELTDPRDMLAYQKILRSLHHKHHKHQEIEVLNNPSDHFTPTSMDID